ncbi:murein transglycosylase A [Luteimonas sp. BDR2-5]|uniref:MltA domain-containing protein n=1 Tax=Proluteimonas luteida TaxID=2878685 RepID=UPI001E5803C7|nr:MltA domain-containing protein [Luteimonas sp. BDR2-5]MCD9027905.1 murein transglycosylase A [Luteimonas sp. BDR2-5]
MPRLPFRLGLLCCATFACLQLHAQLPPDTQAAGPDAQGLSAAAAPDIGQPFETRNAVFEPRAFSQLPGWRDDDFTASVDGMRQSCSALRRRSVWDQLCADFAGVPGNDPAALRAFFERHFYAYQVLSSGREATGKLTGYFEPLLDGSRSRDAQYRYPVYGMPHDLRLLDAGLPGTGTAWLYQDGVRLRAGAPGDGRSQEYQLAMGDMAAGVRDKRFRVRIEGRRVVPYWSRQQIEQNAIQAPVLAWVDDAHKLYSMQVQGSGKIMLREGGLLRLAYAEQNGHPFRPRVTRGSNADLALAGIKARGLIAGSSAGIGQVQPDPKLPAGVNDEVARMIAVLSGQAPAAPRPRPATPSRPQPAPAASPRPDAAGAPAARPAASNRSEVDAMIAALKGEGPAPPPRPVGNAAPATGAGSAASSPGAAAAVPAGAVSSFAGGTTGIPDPSFVFFRNIGDGPEGPIGALGVPLSAGRSVAVDPRTTPLGAPVFISSREPGGSGPMQRLMFAQDTGGAIRGSVRADFFWGFGESAGRLALATNDTMQMWLLLPRQQPISAVAASGMRLRGNARQQLPDCVVADPEFCVEFGMASEE